MKNLFLTVVISIFTILTVSAQSDSKQVMLGLKGGMNFSKVGGDDFGDVKSRTSFNAGFIAEIPITEHISFQPELLYSGQGFDLQERDQDNIFDTDDNVEYQLDYIQVPLLIKAYLIEGLSLEVGPQFGFKINEEIDYQPTADGGDIDINRDDSFVSNFDTSLALGSSYKFDNGFFVNARYTFGLTNIYKDDTVFENIDAKNNVWQFGIGFMF